METKEVQRGPNGPKQEISADGRVYVYVGVPGKVSTGKGDFAKALEKVLVTEDIAQELELRDYAFRDQAEADARFKRFKRLRIAEIEAEEKAHSAREAREKARLDARKAEIEALGA